MKKIVDCEIGNGTIVRDFVDLYKCKIGKDCRIGSFTYIEEDVIIGNNVKIKPFVFIPTGVTIEDGVFIGMGVNFTNDKTPKVGKEWILLKTLVKKGASIGTGAIILPGLIIGENAMVGAGAVVTKDVRPNTTVVGVPAKEIK